MTSLINIAAILVFAATEARGWRRRLGVRD